MLVRTANYIQKNLFHCTLTVLTLPSASASALIPSSSTSAKNFISISFFFASDAFVIAFFDASTRARYSRYLLSVPKIRSHHRNDVEKLFVNAMWWKSWCSAPDQNGTKCCSDHGKSVTYHQTQTDDISDKRGN